MFFNVAQNKTIFSFIQFSMACIIFLTYFYNLFLFSHVAIKKKIKIMYTGMEYLNCSNYFILKTSMLVLPHWTRFYILTLQITQSGNTDHI